MNTKIIAAMAACLMAPLCMAQPLHTNEGRFYIGIQQGPVFNIYENYFSYRENGKAADLITYQVGGVVGYDFNDIFGLRLSGTYGKNAGACNVRETAGGGFYPYRFNSVNAFMDAILDFHGLSDLQSKFRIKAYGGAGAGYTFHMTDPQHPWQKLKDPNTVFGFRFGFIFEYNFIDHLGVFADLCGEAYTDMYNGLMPTAEEQASSYSGYGGFPLDLRAIATLGFLYRF